MRKKILCLMLCFTFCLQSKVMAQFSFDIPSVEAYIADHKNQRSLLLARSTLEASNKLLHEYSKTANKDYKEINVELDKYSRAFDIIDVLYQSLRTSLNTYQTYENISDRVKDYKDLLADFKKRCLDRGNIVSSDKLILDVNMVALNKIAKEGDNLYHSVKDLILYANQWLIRKDHRAFRHGIHLSRKTKILQIIKELFLEKIQTAQIFDVIRIKVQVFDVFNYLLQSCCNRIG